jgi:endonuclease-8
VAVPEGDTVWRACRQLDAALAGHVLEAADLRVPALATADLRGVRVREVRPRGKHQLFRFDNGLTLHTHLRMDGAWKVFLANARRTGGPDHQIRVLLTTATVQAVGYRLPVVELFATAEEQTHLGYLGPDLLGPDWDLDEALARLRAEPDRSIGEALLDQRNLAGIGTLYRAETLFLRGIHPRRSVGAVPDLPALVERARTLLRANTDRPWQTTTGDTRAGERTWVFDRAGRPCRRCRTRIELDSFGPLGQERRSFWCPHCQPI